MDDDVQLTLRIKVSHNKTLIIRNPQQKVLRFKHSGYFLSYLSENVTLLATCEANNIIITFLPIVTKTVTEIVTKIVTKLLQKLLQKSLQKLLQKFYYYSVLYCISWQCLSGNISFLQTHF